MRSVKGAIKKTLGKQCLTKTEFETCLCEVAVSINSQPLTLQARILRHVFRSLQTISCQARVITVSLAKVMEDPEKVNLSLRQQQMVHRTREFWKVWISDYLRNLSAAYQKFRKTGN